ncbi:hypothetical protein CDIK_3595 [Cucumispora dikerogammari]|nr:hypothetical protein CDIK_3595 [Cucumispora dikerogammari]
MDHREDLRRDLVEREIHIGRQKLKKILLKCNTCGKFDTQRFQSAKSVTIENPGEIVGVNILAINKKYKIVMAIDYFSRKHWARALMTKESKKVLDFIKEIHSEKNLHLYYPIKD